MADEAADEGRARELVSDAWDTSNFPEQALEDIIGTFQNSYQMLEPKECHSSENGNPTMLTCHNIWNIAGNMNTR